MLCTRMAKFGYTQWANECRRRISKISVDTYARPLNNTVKTHKPFGQSSVRLLHNLSGNAFVGMSGVIDRLRVEAATARFPFLAISIDHVQNCLKDQFFPHTSYLIKLDIAEFFLSSKHDFLIRNVCSLLPGKALRCWVAHALWYLLHHQSVVFDDVFYRVTKGNGMGARHSGSLANFAFACGVEESFLRNCRVNNLGLNLYLKHFDDILCICGSQSSGAIISSLLCKLAAPPQFVIEHDAASSVAMQMLDLHLHKVRCGPASPHCRIMWRPFVKPTSRHLPLHHDSFHHPSVHLSWPSAEMLRLFRKSSRPFDFERARDLKLQRWAYFFMHPCILEKCRSWTPPPKASDKDRQPEDVRLRIARLILPFHPGLRCLQKSLMSIAEVWNSRACLVHVLSIKIQVTWKSAGTPLHVVCRRLRL